MATLRRGPARPSHRERGAAAVELALLLPLLLLLTGGIVDLGRALHDKVVIADAARDGARMASLGVYDPADVRAQATAAATGLPAGDVTVSVPDSCSPGAGGVDVIAVTVTRTSFDWSLLAGVNGFFGSPVTLPSSFASTAEMRCQ